MPDNRITFSVDFKTDTSTLSGLQERLNAIKNMKVTDLINPSQFKNAEAELGNIQRMADAVAQAFAKTYNSDLGTANLTKFSQELKRMGYDLSTVQSEFYKLGPTGQQAFASMTQSISGLNYQLKETQPWLQKLANTFGNTLRYTFSTRIITGFFGAIRKGFSFMKDLDKSLNNIRIVTGKSSEEMAKFAVQANKAAKALGSGTTDYTNASLIYYQQGLGDREVQARTDVTIKVANITKQSADEVSEQLTAVWNGYRVTAEEAELYIDKLSAVAAHSASDLEELSTAMSKVASGAAAMGVDIDELTAQIATIVSVTRQDASNVGTALKTIYARMGDLAVSTDAVDEFGVSLGDVSSKLAIMGVNVLDQQGNMRDLGDVIAEVAGKWGTWTEAQQQAAAVALAGKRQYNNLIALFNNWDMYESSLETSKTSEGTLQKQQDTYMESLEAHLEQLSAAGERLYNALFDSDSFKGLIDFVSTLVDRFGDLVTVMGGGGYAVSSFASILGALFTNKLTQMISKTANNLRLAAQNTQSYKSELKLLESEQAQVAKTEKAMNEARDKYGVNSKEYIDAQHQYGQAQREAKYQKQMVNVQTRVRRGLISSDVAENAILDIRNNRNADIALQEDMQREAQRYADTGKALGLDFDTEKLNAAQAQLTNQFFAGKIATGDQNVFAEFDAQIQAALDGYKVKIESINSSSEQISANYQEQLKNLGLDEEAIESLVKDNEEIVRLTEEYNELRAKAAAGDKEAEKQAKEIYSNRGAVSRSYQQKVTNIVNSNEKISSANKEKWTNEVFEAGRQYRGATLDTPPDMSKFVADMQQSADVTEKAKAELQELYNTFKTDPSPEHLEALKAKLIDCADGMTDTTDRATELGNRLNTINDNAKRFDGKGFAAKFEEYGQALTRATSTVLMFANGLNTVVRGFVVLNDSSLSAKEKTSQFIMALLGGIAMLIPAFTTLAGAITTANWPLLIMMGVVLALVAIIGVITFAINKHNEAQVKAQKAAEEANKAYEDQKQILEETKQAYDDLKSSIEDYDKAQQAIDDMTAGTDEWREAIAEANQQVLDLMSTYSNLAQFVSVNSNGRLTISEEGKQAILDQQRAQVILAQRNTNIANVRSSQAQLAATQEKLRNAAGTKSVAVEDSGWQRFWRAVASGPYSNDASAFSGYHLETRNVLDDETYNKIITELLTPGSNLYGKSNEELRTQLSAELEISNKELLENLTKGLCDAAKETKALNAQNAILNRTIADANLQGNKEYEQTGLKTIVQQRVAEDTSTIYDDIYNENYEKYKEGKHSRDVAFAEKYAEVMGGEDAGWSANDGKILYNGQEYQVNREEGIKTIVQSEAGKQAAGNATKYIQDYEERNRLLQGNGVRQQVAEDIINGIAEGANIDVSDYTAADLATLTSTSVGYNNDEKASAQRIADSYNKTLNTIKSQLAPAVDQALFGSESAFNEKNLSLKLQRAVGDSLQKAFTMGGGEAITDAANFLKQYSGDELEKVTTIFNSIDWTSRDAGNEFNKAMEDAGLEIKNFDGAYTTLLTRFKSSRSPLNDLVKDFESLKEQIQSLKEITKDLHIGDVIDEDDYEKLISYNKELEDLFVLTEDGYKLIGDIADVEKLGAANIYNIEDYKKAMDDAVALVQGDNAGNTGLANEKFAEDLAKEAEKVIPNLTAADTISKQYADLLPLAGISKEALDEDISISRLRWTGTAQNKKDIAAALGVDASNMSNEDLQQLLNDRQAAANQEIKDTYLEIDEIIKRVQNGEIAWNDKDQQLLASRAKTFEELKGYLNDALISEDNWKKVHKAFVLEQVNDLGYSTEVWETWAKTLGEAMQDTEEATLKTLQQFAALQEINYTDTVVREIEKAQKALDRLKQSADRLAKQEQIGSLTEQVSKQKEILEQEHERLELTKQERDVAKGHYDVMVQQAQAALAEAASSENLDKQIKEIYESVVKEAADGTIEVDQVALAKAYAKAQEEQNTALMAALEQLRDARDDFWDFSDAIEEAEDDILDLQNTIQDTLQQRYDLTIQVQIDTANAERDFYTFMQKMYKGGIEEDNIGINLEYLKRQMSTYSDLFNGTDSGTLNTNMVAMQAAQDALSRARNGEGATEADIKNGYYNEKTGKWDANKAEEDYQKYLAAARADAEKVVELYESAKAMQVKVLNKLSETFDKQLATYQRIQDRLNHDMTLIRLTYGDNAYSRLEQYYDQQSDFYKKQLELQSTQILKYQEEVDKITDKDSEAWKAANQNLQDALAARSQTVEQALQASQEQYENHIHAIVDAWSKAVSGDDRGLDGLIQGWDDITAKQDRYLNALDAAYEVDKLDNAFDMAIDDAALNGMIGAQERLNKLREKELGFLKSKEKISQYDIDRANKELEIEQKRLELQNAEANATKMRLTRDANGNYSYQFVADEDQTAKIRQELADLEHDLKDLDVQRYKDTASEYAETVRQAQQELMDAFLLPEGSEERKTAIDAIKEKYFGENGLLKDIVNDMGVVTDHINKDWQGIFNVSGEEALGGLWGYYDEFMNTVQQDSNNVFAQLMEEADAALAEWKERNKGLLGAADDENTSDLTKDGQLTTEGLYQATASIDEDIQGAIKEFDESMDALRDFFSATADSYEELRDFIDQFLIEMQAQNADIKELKSMYESQGIETDAHKNINDRFTDTDEGEKTPTPEVEAKPEEDTKPDVPPPSILDHSPNWFEQFRNEQFTLQDKQQLAAEQFFGRRLDDTNLHIRKLPDLFTSLQDSFAAQQNKFVASNEKSAQHLADVLKGAINSAQVHNDTRSNAQSVENVFNVTFPNATNAREVEDAIAGFVSTTKQGMGTSTKYWNV